MRASINLIRKVPKRWMTPKRALGVERIALQCAGELLAEGDEGVEDAEQAGGAGG